MSGFQQGVELIVAVCAAMDAPTELVGERGRVFGPAFPGVRRPRKPWRIGFDPVAFAAVLQVEAIDTAWMPLAGGTQADGLEMVADSINAHVGLELSLETGASERLDAPSARRAQAVAALLDGPLDWPRLAARLADA